jgi:GNAT superfamily N-acetyltransferase
MPITYTPEPTLPPADFIDLLHRSTLAARRPVHDLATLQSMIANADILLTARLDGNLIGLSRAITDYAYCTYLSDLAVDQHHQRRGIGRELIRRTHAAAGLHTTLILLAAPAARSYYPHIGMQQHDSCWIIPRTARSG